MNFRVRRYPHSKRQKRPLSIHDFNTSNGACECAAMLERLGERATITWLAGIVPWIKFMPDGTTLVIEAEARLA